MRVAVVLVIATLVLVPYKVWLLLNGPAALGSDLIDPVLYRLGSMAFGPVGLLIAIYRRANRIGWILIAFGFVATVAPIADDEAQVVSNSLVALALVGMRDIAWPLFPPLFGALVLLFPDGHLPSRRWRWLAWALFIWPISFVAIAGLAPTAQFGSRSIPNPTGGAPGALGQVAETLLPVMAIALIPIGVGVLAAVLFRFRRASGVERKQLELVAYVALLTAVIAVLSGLGAPGPWPHLIPVAEFTFPIAIVVAVLRYHLYDIDLLVNRALVYAGLSLALAGTYFSSVLLFRSLLQPLLPGSGLSVALSTLAVIALFAPLRRWIQSAVDRRFYRRRYDAGRTLDAFSGQLANEVDLDAVRGDLLTAVGDTMQPVHVSLWLRR
ncbi:MAG TPA: hypothetical protein VIN70_07415 [Candidatus Limnocylindria bacterium]